MNLDSPLAEILNIKDFQKKALDKIHLKTAKDLLWHFPFRYEKIGELKTIADIGAGDDVSIRGKIEKIKHEKTWRKKLNITGAILNDGTGLINLTWFHQPFIAKILQENDLIIVSGKVQTNKKGLYLANPTYEKISEKETATQTPFLAVYPETRGISSKWFRFAIKKILTGTKENLNDILPSEILKKYKLPSLKNALLYIHQPKNKKDAEAARKRFAFEEIFFIQLSRVKKRKELEKHKAIAIQTKKTTTDSFIKKLGFKPTNSQTQAISGILEDISKNKPMARFMEGDVGSGKTAVAAVASFSVLKSGHQTAYMAPTEVLARQLFESFCTYFENLNARIGLLTSSESKKFPSKITNEKFARVSKSKLLKWVAEGEIDIIIGTHSLIQEAVKFSAKDKKTYLAKNLALVIIDEQHRFGINQRAALANKRNETNENIIPHLLSMSATPIPRTLALTVYGDLDLTVIDEMPPGRKKIITEITPPQKRHSAYQKIEEELEKGRQAYVICPRIEPNEQKKETLATLNMKTVKEEYEKLSKEIFPQYKIGMLYGKINPKEKEKTMKEFEAGKLDILVSTSVIEVGVNIPNATVIIIEGAERFGLAQLHQLRGRVLRSTYQPYCFIFTESKTKKTINRLNALKTAKNGFELAEYDLEFRGAGELAGQKQWGLSDVGMEALKNINMVEAAREEAKNIIQEDSELKKYPLLRKRIEEKHLNIHFE